MDTEKKIIESIQKTFEEVFGNVATSALLGYIEDEGLSLDAPLDVEKFQELLRSLFGKGANALERAIVQNLCRDLNKTIPTDLSISEVIKQLREKHER